MNNEDKGKLIWQIIGELKIHATLNKKPFDAGNTFFSLVFKTDDEIRTIAKLTGV